MAPVVKRAKLSLALENERTVAREQVDGIG